MPQSRITAHGKRPSEATSSNSLQNGGEWPSEATLPSVKDLLPFRFRYAAVQNNHGKRPSEATS
jgi:hypothetical protein